MYVYASVCPHTCTYMHTEHTHSHMCMVIYSIDILMCTFASLYEVVVCVDIDRL